MVLVGTTFAQHYQQTNLVSDLPSPAALTQDANLVNPWGLARSSGSPWWAADNGTGKSTLYNGNTGAPLSLVVTIPGATADSAGTPTGVVFNGTPDFGLPNGKPATFLFVTEDGTVAGWNSGAGTTAVTVAKSSNSVFKGATIAQVGDANYLYVADFRQGRIRLYDGAFHPVHFIWRQAFEDERIPRGFVPFNVQNIGGNLFVSYALQASSKTDEVDAPGLGYVDVFSPTGRLLRRLQHGPWLNAPWGMTLAPSDFGKFSHQLLIGQFGSGQIAAYDPFTGAFLGLMLNDTASSETVLTIDGLWALSFGNGANAGPLNTLFFTAGIQDEQHGLFGTLKPIASELTQGNGQ
jgi:uncharacterized protein (TIGR03118 family)